MLNARVVVTCSVAAMALGGCASPERPPGTLGGVAQTSGASSTASAPSVSPTSAAPGQINGIVVETCTADAVTLTGYDPATGTTNQSVTFSVTGLTTRACQWSSTVTPMERPRRDQFSADYSKLAAQLGTQVGYIGAGGSFVDLTPAKGSNYGATTPTQSLPVFNPATGRLWYQDNATRGLGSVDPRVGLTSSHAEPAQPGGPPGGPFDFSANGQTVVNETFGAVSPDGKLSITLDPADGFHIAAADGTAGYGTYVPLTSSSSVAPGCYAKNFIDQHRVLCVGDGTQGSPLGLYVLTLSNDGKQLSQIALLPPSENAPIDELADPSARQVAFIAAGALYVTSASANQEPRKLVDLPGEVRLVGWS
jgi:hypothetical protein